MGTVHVGELSPGTKRCKVCQEPINEGAWKCIHCQSDQGRWRSRLGVSVTMMSLIVALVSVLATAVPAVKLLVTPENSDLIASPQGATPENISVLVSNQGIRPGSVRSGALVLNDNTVLVLHIKDMPKNEPKIIEPGKAELIKLYASNKLEVKDDWKKCALRLMSMDFTGQRRNDTALLECADTLPFISANTQ